MAFPVSSGGSRKRKQHKIRFYKRGGGPLSPGDFPGAGGAPTVPANYTEFPTTIPTSTQVGGGFGFESGGETSTYGGSYAPWSRNCTSGAIVSRGGNDVMSGGRRRKARKTKKGSKKGGARKSRKTKKGGKKYRQRGCSKNKRGGNVILM